VFNLGSGKGISVLEAIASFEKVSEKKLNYKIGERRAGDVVAVYSDSSKVQDVLKWDLKHNIDNMMKTAWEWEIYRTEHRLI
jgi:UDP-glucose 4-epimerase